MRCPCRKKSETTTYADCCRPYHDGTRICPTAATLMRSRYSAYALKLAPYLQSTWHPSTRPASIAFPPGQEWALLRIIATEEHGDCGTVEFVARSRVAGRIEELHEISRFVQELDRWYYLDGIIR